jgi:hypothetical protein
MIVTIKVGMKLYNANETNYFAQNLQPHLKWSALLHALWRLQQKGPAKEKSLFRCTLGLAFKPSTSFPHCIVFRKVLRKTATFVLYGNNWFFITVFESIYSAVRFDL